MLLTRTNLKTLFQAYKKFNRELVKCGATRKIGLPDSLSQTIIVFILQKIYPSKKFYEKETGDLYTVVNSKERFIECKSSINLKSPPSLSPTAKFDYMFFLDASNYENDFFVLYRVKARSKTQSFRQLLLSSKKTVKYHRDMGTRAKINFLSKTNRFSLNNKGLLVKVYEGTFNKIIE